MTRGRVGSPWRKLTWVRNIASKDHRVEGILKRTKLGVPVLLLHSGHRVVYFRTLRRFRVFTMTEPQRKFDVNGTNHEAAQRVADLCCSGHGYHQEGDAA